ncbi:MAG: hypothetical protein EBZ96_09660 [Synechococcaceae bacterium WB9_3_282]|nr:hypothetical protein [Synechococcaceae bacterium WB9_3_282]
MGDHRDRPVAPDIKDADQGQRGHAQQAERNMFKRARYKTKPANDQHGEADIAAQYKMPLTQ